MNTQNSKPWSVDLWSCHPDEDHDDSGCITGDDFETEAEAREVFNHPWPHFERAAKPHFVAYVTISGPARLERFTATRMNARYNPRRVAREAAESDREWQRETARQAGMAFGIEAFNEEMGW